MTDNEIIKALECCRKKECSTCPCYDDEIECGEMLIGHTIDLINRRKAEIEKLRSIYIESSEELGRLTAEIEKLKEDNLFHIRLEALLAEQRDKRDILIEQIDAQNDELRTRVKTAKAEAIKEFAERLKERLQWDCEFDSKLVFESDIDNLAKEMTE